MDRYLKTLRLFWTTSLSAQWEYQINFLVELIAMIGTLLGSLFILSIFFSEGRQIGTWTWETALVVQGVYTLLDGVTNSLLRPNLSDIVNHVREGTLDFILIKPIDSQFWLSLRTFSPAGLSEIILGLLIVFWAVDKTGNELSFLSIFMFFISLVCAIIILYSLWFIIASTSIWFVKTWNATEVLRAVLAAGRYPVIAYPVPLRIIFTLVLPVAFLTTVPSELILGLTSFSIVIQAVLFSLLFFFLSRSFWTFALKHYSSASS